MDDAMRTLRLFRVEPYDRPVPVMPGVTLTFRDAGHILGSASAWLDCEENGTACRLLFSGDIGQYDSPILRDPDPDGRADIVVMESTYGNRGHRDRAATLEEFGEILLRARRSGGNVLIPAFAVGRSQDILYEISQHFDAWQLADWRMFLDSPMAIEASQVYWRHPELYDDEAADARRRLGAMPLLPNLALTRTPAESMAINAIRAGAIIIAGSGMCTGGRIVHHLKHNLSRPECCVIFTGFQAVGTLGRALVDGRPVVRIHGDEVRVAATIHTLGGFSAHAGQADLLRWHAGLKDRPPTWLVHGEVMGAEGLREALAQRGVEVRIAKPMERTELVPHAGRGA
jgi:metallo-beta-lactamase family protein